MNHLHLHQYIASRFYSFTKGASRLAGHPSAFVVALAIILVWGLTGPLLHYSDTWQLVINTGTTVVTFLLGFLIQNSQNRESMALQLKIDELLRVIAAARNQLLDLEELDETQLFRLKHEFLSLAAQARDERPLTPTMLASDH